TTIGHLVPCLLAAILRQEDDFEIAGHDDQGALAVAHHVAVHQLDAAFIIGLDAGDDRAALRRTADVEGPHGQLGARLADRLRRDDADRFADIHPRAARQVATIAGRADAVAALAG